MNSHVRFGLVKSGLDAHTLGITSLAQLLEECSFRVFKADTAVTEALDRISESRYFQIFRDWLVQNHLSHLGFSYRLDPRQAVDLFSRMVHHLKEGHLYSADMKSPIKKIYFAGLPEACDIVTKTFQGQFPVFRGDETSVETLERLGIPEKLIPRSIRENSIYDDLRLTFGKTLIREEKQFTIRPLPSGAYSDFGTHRDHLIKRLSSACRRGCLPLMRVHAGPYLSDRERALALFSDWLKKLAKARFLDIVSVGSSQLSQSMFGEDWGDRPNGGGVPFNSEFELQAIREDAAPMLVRAYSATKNIPDMAKILERNLNMAWHALSLWWFNQIDGRGPLSLRQSLFEHMETLKYISSVGKPFEPNLPHHFAFRMGYFPVPYLWEGRDKFANAVNWTTIILDGGVHLVDDRGNKLNVHDRLMEIKNRNTPRPQR